LKPYRVAVVVRAVIKTLRKYLRISLGWILTAGNRYNRMTLTYGHRRNVVNHIQRNFYRRAVATAIKGCNVRRVRPGLQTRNTPLTVSLYKYITRQYLYLVARIVGTVVLNPRCRHIPGALATPHIHTHCHLTRIGDLRTFVVRNLNNLVVTGYLARTPVKDRPLTQQLVATYIAGITVHIAQLKPCVLVRVLDVKTLRAYRKSCTVPLHDLVGTPATAGGQKVRMCIPVNGIR